MLTTLEATYENGQITFAEPPPVQEKTNVLVTFLEEIHPQRPAGGAVRIGSMKGMLTIPDDFNEPLDDLKDYMY
jgi:uncharacterized protein YdeI (YjbR/CyaY-like superfamily)